MNQIDISNLLLKIVLASFGATGILEWLKNFIKTPKTWVYSIIMPMLAIGCFFICEFCNVAVIGSILTIGCVQLDYQVIVQGFKTLIDKVGINKTLTHNEQEK